MNLEEIAVNIKKKDNGIYYSMSESDISYPDDGNMDCLQLEEDSFWFKHRNNIISESVKKYNMNNHFFDIGGGNGFVAKRLQENGQLVTLIEPGELGAINAQKRGVNNVLCSTLEDAGINSNTLDSVGLFDVVEHIEDDKGFLQKIFGFLKPGGHVYISVPAFNALWSNEDKDAGHFRRYSINQIKSVLQKSGYEIIYSTYIFSILPIPVFLFRTLPSKLGLNKNSNDLDKHQNEHKENKGLVSKILDKIWAWELGQVKKNKRIPFGGSSFIVAKKPKHK
jgi:2-polyprenyl-3-methyl-5-hydroxy-6-metoxy-1,4-benzoquinol methylase